MWVTVESGEVVGAPCARGKHSATLLGGFVYVLGGRGAGGCVPLRDFWRYCLASGRWERLECRGEAPPALQEHSATPHAGNLYVFGGEAGALSYETPLWIYDTQIQTWRKLSGQSSIPSKSRGTWSARGVRATGGAGAAAGPRGRRGHSAHALKDCLLVYGGYKDLRGSTNELWAFHYETETWHQVRTATAGPARHRHAAALHDNRLYVHGGQCDLRDCADLWHYDTMSRVWAAVRTPAKLSPSARSGHAGLRAGAHLYIFGGEARGHPTNELWRFHFATETWEQIMQSIKWPSPRVDSRALLVGGGEARACTGPPAPAPALAPAPRAAPAPAGFLREISKLSSFHIRRAARCSYSVLAGDQDSTESLVRADRASRTARTSRSSLCKSRSAYVIDERQPADGGECPDLSRDPVSVPDFDALSPRAHTRTALVYLDSDDEGVPESTSTKLTRDVATEDEAEAEAATSDYASADAVDAAAGFSNPHYLGPDVRALGGRGAGGARGGRGEAAGDIELQELGGRRGAAAGRAARNGERQLHLLLVGGREPPHVALLQSPLSMWSYRLL